MKIRNLLSFASTLAVSLTFGYAVYSSPGPRPSPQRQIISCSSDDMKRNYCEADVRGGVQLVKQRSDAACVLDRTWGYNDHGIWVDRGCRADFQVGGSGPDGGNNVYNIYCASDNGRRNLCPTDTRGGVQMVRKRSDAACDYGNSWGYNDRGIWVDRGCRADFQIGGAGRDADRGRDRDDHRDRDDRADRDDRRDRDDHRADDRDGSQRGRGGRASHNLLFRRYGSPRLSDPHAWRRQADSVSAARQIAFRARHGITTAAAFGWIAVAAPISRSERIARTPSPAQRR